MRARAAAEPRVNETGGSAAVVVLASGSHARLTLLHRAGLQCRAERAGVDEYEIKRALRREGAGAAKAAEALAELKAVKVSRRYSGALVIGADQLLVCAGEWFDKPADIDQARAQLSALRGRTHELVTAVVVVRDGTRLWHHLAQPRLHMRAFSDAFLDHYLAVVGAAACESVGAYQLEGLGAQLFSQLEGDYFAMLGLPLLPLLDFLRHHGVVPT